MAYMPVDIRLPSLPLGPRVFGEVDTGRGRLQMDTFGGPSRISLTWDAMEDAAEHLTAARRVLQRQRDLLAQAMGVAPAAPLSWRIGPFLARLAAAHALTGEFEARLESLIDNVHTAHALYREAEAQARAWMELARRTSQWGQVEYLRQVATGNFHYPSDHSLSTGLMAGGLFSGVFSRFPLVSAAVQMVAIINDHAGIPPSAMGRHQHVLHEDAVAEFSFTADGSFHTYLDTMSRVADAGDLAVSVIEHPNGETVYAVHLPGFSPGQHLEDGELDLHAGRGGLSLIDAWSNDSEHMAGIVEKALENAGVPDGAEIMFTGYSMGGMHTLNLVNHRRLQDRYTVRGATTIGTPARSQRVDPEVPVAQFHDRNDPLHYITGEQNHTGSNRINIVYDYVNPEVGVPELDPGQPHQSLENLGDDLLENHAEHGPLLNHAYAHNVDAIGVIEDQMWEDLTDEEREHLDGLRSFFDGDIETYVYDTEWESLQDPEHRYPWEWESREDTEYVTDMVEELRQPEEWALPDGRFSVPSRGR